MNSLNFIFFKFLKFSKLFEVVTYQMINRKYGPTGLESQRVWTKESCICTRDTLSKFHPFL